jgi:hypothetical protein
MNSNIIETAAFCITCCANWRRDADFSVGGSLRSE